MTDRKSNSSPDEGEILLREIAISLVDDAESVRVERTDQDGVTALTLYVPESEAGKVIGRNGRTAQSIRIIVMALGVKLNRRYSLIIEQVK